jgi:hypothetical protein
MLKLSILIAILHLALSTHYCPIFKCDDLLGRSSLCKRTVDSDLILLNTCSGDNHCNYSKNSPNLYCQPNVEQNIKLFPGLPCSTNSDCLSNKCINNKCTDKSLGETCSSHENCEIGQSCTDYICKPSAKEGQQCKESNDCERHLGCRSGKCLPYYSMPDGTKIEYSLHADAISFCKSGFADDFKCVSTLNNHSFCFNYCGYTGLDGEVIPSYEACECGFNNNGFKYCRLGSEEQVKKDAVLKHLTFLKYETNCHTTERTTCSYVLKHNADPNVTRLYREYIIAKIYAENKHKIHEIDPCVLKTVFPELAMFEKDWKDAFLGSLE